MDLSGMPASKKAEEAEKGYFAGKRNIYGRQLARILVPETQEIVAECLYPGNRLSCKVFKDMVKSEHPSDFIPENVDPVVKTLNGLGMKRFVRQILSVSGRVVMNKGKVLQVILNPLYPLIDRIRTAFVALLKPYGITVSLGEI